MKWAVQLLQSKFDNVPLALDTSNIDSYRGWYFRLQPCKRKTDRKLC